VHVGATKQPTEQLCHTGKSTTKQTVKQTSLPTCLGHQLLALASTIGMRMEMAMTLAM